MGRVQILDVILNQDGQPITGATVEVRNAGNLALATLYAAESGATTVANPMTSDLGSVSGWVEEGSYQVVIAGDPTIIQTTRRVELVKAKPYKEFRLDDPGFGAHLDGSTDDVTAMNAAIAAVTEEGFGYIRVPDGASIMFEGPLSDIVTSYSGIIGRDTTFKMGPKTPAGAYTLINAQPTTAWAEIVNPLSADFLDGDVVLNLTSSLGVVFGQELAIRNKKSGDMQQGAELWARVIKVLGGGTQLVLDHAAMHDFFASASSIYLINSPLIGMKFKGFTIDATAMGATNLAGPFASNGLHLDRARDYVVDDCHFDFIIGQGLFLTRGRDGFARATAYKSGSRPGPDPPAAAIAGTTNDLIHYWQTDGEFHFISNESEGFGPGFHNGGGGKIYAISRGTARGRGHKLAAYCHGTFIANRVDKSNNQGIAITYGSRYNRFYDADVNGCGEFGDGLDHPNIQSWGMGCHYNHFYGLKTTKNRGTPRWDLRVSPSSRSGHTNIGEFTITALTNTDDIDVFSPIASNNYVGGTATILSVDSPTQVTVDKAALGTGTFTFAFGADIGNLFEGEIDPDYIVDSGNGTVLIVQTQNGRRIIGTLQTQRWVEDPITLKSSGYTLTSKDGLVVFTGGAAILPACTSLPAGTIFKIKFRQTTGTLPITPTGADTVESDAAGALLYPKESITLRNDGASNWEVI